MKPVLPALLLLSLPSLALAQEPAPAAPVEAAPAVQAEAGPDVSGVDQRLRIVERKLEILDEDAAKKKAESPKVTAGDKGFNLKSADDAFVVKIRGYLHADAREFIDDKALQARDTFVVRRARPLVEASFWNVADLRFMPDFGGGQASIYDAYVDLRPFPWLKLRAGKFKPPVGLERLQSATAIVFPERGLPTSLVPNRDIGFQLHGVIAEGLLTYEVGVFNGTVDGGITDVDQNHAKDFVGRLFTRPFASDPYGLLANLGIGIAASTGNQKGAPATFQAQASGAPRRLTTSTPSLPSFRTAGQNSFFSYLVNDDVPDATVYAKGRRSRLAPQAYYYYENYGLLGEYVVSKQSVWKGDANANLTHTAWQIQGEIVFGGKPTFEGVTVTQPFDLKKGQWGALELAARYNDLKLDADTFPTFADETRSASRARAVGGVVNWHWSKNIKLVLAYEHTWFDGGAKGGDRTAENVLFQRIQGAF